MDTAVLTREIARQQSMFDALAILADLTRSDVLFYDFSPPGQLVVTHHARPHTVPSIYPKLREGRVTSLDDEPALERAIRTGARVTHHLILDEGSVPSAQQELLPVHDSPGSVMGVLSVESSDVEHASYRHRGGVLHRTMRLLKEMVVRGELRGAASLSEVTDQDGLLVVDAEMRIRYASNVAETIYRRLGLADPWTLVDQRIDALETGDERLIEQAIRERCCLQREEPVRGRIWVRKAIPLVGDTGSSGRKRRWLPLTDALSAPTYALLLIRDVSTERLQEQEQVRLEAMIREIHHRVKNNLQTIISLARREIRRSKSAETKRALDEFVNRVFAVADVHEFLAAENTTNVQLRDVTRQIATRVQASLLSTDSRISIGVEGDPVRLPSKQATACALMINELVQNAVEHAFDPGDTGYIRIQLEDEPDRIQLRVVDNGRGLPPAFDLSQANTLGLKIVQSLAQDLHGELALLVNANAPHGLVAQVAIPKPTSGGN